MTEEQIWDILDGNALPEVQKEHAQLLVTDDEYRAHFAEFSTLHNQLCNLELDAPSMRFEQNLMERLQPSVTMQRSKDRLPLYFLGVMSVLAAVFVGVMSALSAPSVEPSLTFLETPNTVLASRFFGEGVISWVSNPVFFYGFIVLNIILFFVVLDKKVFEPFFEKRGK
jgi:anti-sigma factor RsiW